MKPASNTAKLLRNVPLPDEISTVHDNAVVIDMGSGTTRIGFSGDDAPRLTHPTVIGTSTDKAVTASFSAAYKQRDRMALSRVMERGLVRDWGGFENMMHELDTLLGMSKDANTPLLMSEAALAPKDQRETMTQILFERIRVPSLYFAMAPVLGLYASGRATGLVIELGHGTCSSVPVFEGFGLFHSILQCPLGGDDLTRWLGARAVQAPAVPAHHQYDVWQYLKEVHCSAAQDRAAYEAALSAGSHGHTEHRLPDGARVVLGPERWSVCESLFDPSVVSPDAGTVGLPTLAMGSVQKCDTDISSLLYGNVVMVGGTSLFKGFCERFGRELQSSLHNDKVRITASTERDAAAFVGGSILASLPTFQDMWVTKAEYDEVGPSITMRNCF